MIDELAALVTAESPSSDPAKCASAGRVLFDIVGSAPEIVEAADGREHYVWRWGSGRAPVVVIGHIDTVWPAGTITRWPFAVDEDTATGPGVYDMKCGLVVAAAALRSIERRDVVLIVNSDEELGSVTSRSLIESVAANARAALVMESGVRGAVKVARKGVGMYSVAVSGRAAHAGLEPARGVNALVEAAHQTLAIASMGAGETTVTPTVASAGTARNVVPASALIDVDVRVTTLEEAARIDTAMHSLSPVLDGASLSVGGGLNRPPLERKMADELYALACSVGSAFDFSPGAAEVGGGSDGNFTAAMGIPTLDGLGGDGGGAHAEGEWVSLSSLPLRVQLLAGMIERLQ